MTRQRYEEGQLQSSLAEFTKIMSQVKMSVNSQFLCSINHPLCSKLTCMGLTWPRLTTYLACIGAYNQLYKTKTDPYRANYSIKIYNWLDMCFVAALRVGLFILVNTSHNLLLTLWVEEGPG